MKVDAVSIVVCTYNRARLLRETLASMQAMTVPPGCAVEIIVVDNNSTDDTTTVIAESAREGPLPIVALTEKRQGKSFALNTALARAQGDVLALTDDDVIAPADWLSHIVDDFRAREVTFVFGKVLPRWSRLPPPELLTPPAAYLPDNTGQRLPIGANLAFSRAALVSVAGWRTDLGKVNNTLISGEDHEIFVRLRRHALYAGYYDPQLTVRHFVPEQRLTRRYFRRWFFWHGKTQALMLNELYPNLDMSQVPHVAGVPRFAYRQALHQCWRWLRTRGRSDALSALIEELRLIQYGGLLSGCWRRRFRPAARRG
jgi:glycosyltransferase involved in cell wall biosynthesis